MEEVRRMQGLAWTIEAFGMKGSVEENRLPYSGNYSLPADKSGAYNYSLTNIYGQAAPFRRITDVYHQ